MMSFHSWIRLGIGSVVLACLVMTAGCGGSGPPPAAEAVEEAPTQEYVEGEKSIN